MNDRTKKLLSLASDAQTVQTISRKPSGLLDRLFHWSSSMTDEVTEVAGRLTQMAEADVLRLQERWEEAIEAYEALRAEYPDWAEPVAGLGRCYQRRGKLAEAIEAFEQAVRLQSFDGELRLCLAKAYQEAGEPEAAIRQYQRAVKLNPDDLEARFGLGLVYDFDGQLGEARACYEAIIDVDTSFLPAMNNLGSIHVRMGDYSAAEAVFRQLVAQAPEFPRGHLGLAVALDKSGQWAEAQKHYRHVLTLKLNRQNREYVWGRLQALRAPKSTTAKRRRRNP